MFIWGRQRYSQSVWQCVIELYFFNVKQHSTLTCVINIPYEHIVTSREFYGSLYKLDKYASDKSRRNPKIQPRVLTQS